MSHINSLPYIGRAVMYAAEDDEQIIHGMNLLRLKADRKIISPEYAEAYFQTPCFKQKVLAITNKAVNQASFSVRALKSVKIPVPSIEDQIKIVSILNSIRHRIEFVQIQIEKCNQLAKSRFVEMFGDGGYERVPINDLVQSKMPSAKRMFERNDVIKYIDISSVDNVSYEVSGYTEYVFNEAPSRAQQCIQKGDLLVSTVRPNLKNIAINGLDDVNLVASSGFCVLRCIGCPPEYMKAVVCSDHFTYEMCQLTTGANYPAIRNADVLGYMVPKPPFEQMQKYAAFVRQADKLRLAAWRFRERLQMVYDSKVWVIRS